MKKSFLWLSLGLLLQASAWAQLPSQVKPVLPNTTSILFNWDYQQNMESTIDSFVLQGTAFGNTTTITSPYDQETIIPQVSIRSFNFSVPTITAGQKAFFRLIARKVGLADSIPSNVVEIDVVATPQAPTNLRFP